MYRRYIAIFAWPRRRDDRYAAVRPFWYWGRVCVCVRCVCPALGPGGAEEFFTPRRRRVRQGEKWVLRPSNAENLGKQCVVLMMKCKTHSPPYSAITYISGTRPLLDRYSTVTRPLHPYVMSSRYGFRRLGVTHTQVTPGCDPGDRHPSAHMLQIP